MEGRRREAAASSVKGTRAGRASSAPRLSAVALALVAGLALAFAAAFGAVLRGAEAAPSGEYRFVKVAGSVRDNFDPSSFGCATINARGDVAFRSGRVAPNGFDTDDVIYRADAGGGPLTAIAGNGGRFEFIGRNPSMNDSGAVSFAARRDDGTELILRDNGATRATIASTAGRYNFFGFDTSVSDGGVVAFKAELDREFGFDEGLFSGRGGEVTTRYLASTSQFDGTDSRPSINNDNARIAFEERRDGAQGIFATRDGGFETIAEAGPDGFVGEPTFNDGGTAAFERSFADATTGEFVSEIATGDGGPLTTVADTRGRFASFGFRPPSLNNAGDVAFLATLDSGTDAIFVGRDAGRDRVISTGDALDGSTVQGLRFCEEGLSDTGKLTFIADFEAPNEPSGLRTAVFRATPRP